MSSNDNNNNSNNTAGTETHDDKRQRTAAELSTNQNNNNNSAASSSAVSSSSSTHAAPPQQQQETSLITIPLAQFVALTQQLHQQSQQLATVQQRPAERVDVLSQQLVQRTDRINDLSIAHERLARTCDERSADLNRCRSDLETEQESAFQRLQARDREWNAKLAAERATSQSLLGHYEHLSALFYEFETVLRPRLLHRSECASSSYSCSALC